MASDALSLALVNAQVLLADCATFQALVHTGGDVPITDPTFTAAVAAAQADRSTYRTVAQAAIKKWWLLPTDPMPRALLKYERDAYHQGGRNAWTGENVASLYLEFNTPASLQGEENYEAAGADFTDKVGAIRREMMELQATGSAPSPAPANVTYMGLMDVALQNIGQADPDDNNGADFWVAFFYLGWMGTVKLQS